MIDDFDRDYRKNKKKNNLQKHKNKHDNDYNDEQRFISKSKKAFKHKIEDMRSDEIWEEWKDYNK